MVFRLQGGYFAIGTWVVAEVYRLLIANTSTIGGGSGTSLTAMRGIPKSFRESVTFWIALALLVIVLALVYLLLRSRYGLGLTAMRDSETASESQGIAVERTKLTVYLISAVGCGLAGALYFLNVSAHLAGCGLRGELERVHHLHRGDRRHRHYRGADHRHASVLCVARSS